MLTSADSQANVRRFVQRVIESETVWFLELDGLAADVQSHSDGDADVLMFWSDRAYADRARQTSCPEHEVVQVPLLEFLFQWLAGMDEDGVLAGVNWTGDLAGTELDPAELQDEILEAMSDEMRDHYIETVERLIEEQDGAEPPA